jgi:hypothetical protein
MANTTFPTRVLAPIVATARRLDWSERRAFLDDLRRDAPMMVAEVERILTAADVTAAEQAIAPWPALLARLRQFVPLRVISGSTPHQRQNGAD